MSVSLTAITATYTWKVSESKDRRQVTEKTHSHPPLSLSEVTGQQQALRWHQAR